jgi:hypothetical protein
MPSVNPTQVDYVSVFVNPPLNPPRNGGASDLVWMRCGSEENNPRSPLWPQHICYIEDYNISVKQSDLQKSFHLGKFSETEIGDCKLHLLISDNIHSANRKQPLFHNNLSHKISKTLYAECLLFHIPRLLYLRIILFCLKVVNAEHVLLLQSCLLGCNTV